MRLRASSRSECVQSRASHRCSPSPPLPTHPASPPRHSISGLRTPAHHQLLRNGSGQGAGRVRLPGAYPFPAPLLTARSVPNEFVKDGLQFVNRCTKPDKVRHASVCLRAWLMRALEGIRQDRPGGRRRLRRHGRHRLYSQAHPHPRKQHPGRWLIVRGRCGSSELSRTRTGISIQPAPRNGETAAARALWRRGTWLGCIG